MRMNACLTFRQSWRPHLHATSKPMTATCHDLRQRLPVMKNPTIRAFGCKIRLCALHTTNFAELQRLSDLLTMACPSWLTIGSITPSNLARTGLLSQGPERLWQGTQTAASGRAGFDQPENCFSHPHLARARRRLPACRACHQTTWHPPARLSSV